MKKSLNLLDQIIEVAKYEDAARCANSKKLDCAGESWTVCHLKNLKELIISENAEGDNNRTID